MTNSYFVNSQTLFAEAQECINVLKKIPLAKGFTEDNLWHILFAAKNLNLPIDIALRGFYVIGGKIEMTSGLMAQIIRAHGHTLILQDLTEKLCVLKGIRKDNENSWISTFSIQDAIRAGLYDEKKFNVWRRFPKRMLYARALSALARDLFSDILAGFYTEGEISSDLNTEELPEDSTPMWEWVNIDPSSQEMSTHNSLPEEKEETHEPQE